MCLACFAGGGASSGDAPDAVFPDDAAPLPWPDGSASGGTLRWTGVAGLRLDLGGAAIAFDPFASRPGLFRTLFRRPRPDLAAVRARFSGLDAVFFGHTHYDHAMDLGAVAEASPDAVIHGSRTTIELARRLGVAETRLVEVSDADVFEAGPFRVETDAGEHGVVPVVRHVDRYDLPARGLPWTPFRYPRGDVFAWRVEAGGRTFFIQGSAGIDEAALARQGRVDALLACLAARHGTPRYLEHLGERLEPALLLPIHHDDFFRPLEAQPRPVKTLDWPGFLRDAERLAQVHGTHLVLPARDRDHGW